MRSRIIVGVLLVLGMLSPLTVATSGARGSPVRHVSPRQWAIVNFDKTTQVSGRLLNAGQYLIVHDDEKMDRGEACTSFYRFGETGNGAQEEAVSFHCIPRERPGVAETKLALTAVAGDTYGCTSSWGWQMNKLAEYQFAGDPEGHGVPESELAATEMPMAHGSH
jgi:hypothetical protein